MTTTFVLDTAGVEAAADPPRSARFLAAVEAARRRGPVRFVTHSAVLIETYSGRRSIDDAVDRLLGRGECQVVTSLPRTVARDAALRRQRHTDASAVDALVAQEAAARPGSYILTSDPIDLNAVKGRRTTVLSI